MMCPGDRTELSPRRYESDIAIDACETCGGAWLDPGELERIQKSLDRDYSAELRAVPDTVARAYAQARARGAPPRDCPRCRTPLDRSEHGYCSQILVDACGRCGGVWLDSGELKALEVFFERARIEAGVLRRGFFGGLAKR